MQVRKIWDADDARACLAAAKAVRLRPAAWALEHGVDARSLNAWRINLERGQRGAGVRLVELVAAAPDPPAVYRIRCGVFEIEALGEVDDDRLGRLLRVMAASC